MGEETVDLKEKVLSRLKQVIDPGTLTDVVSMGLIKNIDIREDGKITLDFQPSSPACPLALPLALKIKEALLDLSQGKDPCITIKDHSMADEINKYLANDI
jgi:metal-sulfur cluster biosynthetic enzyme